MIHVYSTYECITTLVLYELEKVQNYSVMSPKISEISQPVCSSMMILYKNGKSQRKIAKKVGFTFFVVQYVIKVF